MWRLIISISIKAKINAKHSNLTILNEAVCLDDAFILFTMITTVLYHCQLLPFVLSSDSKKGGVPSSERYFPCR